MKRNENDSSEFAALVVFLYPILVVTWTFFKNIFCNEKNFGQRTWQIDNSIVGKYELYISQTAPNHNDSKYIMN